MTCANCGSALPDGAFFCGECGRAVSAAAPARPFLEQTMQPTRISEPEARDSWWTSDVPSVDDVPAPRGAESPEDDRETCGVCGAAMSGADIFCGECGNVSRTVSSAFSSTRDTATLRSDPATGADPEPIALERAQGERFILQFSTGESVAVFGTGLIGRNPLAEPGEYFDQVVRMLDPTRSVSKTHLEFGQEVGAFWVRDRYSGNGTVVREPDRAPFRCDPGKRYLLARGSRVDVGEQFFVLS